jgi:pseudaminic acid cytidylyltransferase
MKSIALIIARAGSKRIKNKNIKNFFGKPIISYPINSALRSGVFDKLIVSTESIKIKKLAIKFGAHVPFLRPKPLANDKTSTIAVIKHAIKKLKIKDNEKSAICCIYPVTPLITKEDFIKSKKFFLKNKVDFLVPVLKTINKRQFFKNKKGFLREWKNKKYKKNLFSDSGQFYWGWTKSFLKSNNIFSNKSKPYMMKKNSVIDVNTLNDWKLLKKMYLNKYKL